MTVPGAMDSDVELLHEQASLGSELTQEHTEFNSIIEQALQHLAQRNDSKEFESGIAKLLGKIGPQSIHSMLSEQEQGWTIRGRTRTGRMADVPWIALHPADSNASATGGCYLVYLFAFDGSAAYLSLHQGTENLRDFQLALPKRSWDLRRIVGDQPNLLMSINLRSRNARPKKYELANAYAVQYDRGSVPQLPQLKTDLLKMIGLLKQVMNSGYQPDPTIEPTHMLLKWSNSVEPRTLELHQQVAEEHGSVWWGAFGDRSRQRISLSNQQLIRSQLEENIQTHAYLYRNGEAWRTRVQDIRSNPDEVDTERVPSYYTKDQCNFFVRLSDFEQIDPEWPAKNLLLRSDPNPDTIIGALRNQTTPLLVFARFDPAPITSVTVQLGNHKEPPTDVENDSLLEEDQPEEIEQPPIPWPAYSLADCARDTHMREEILSQWCRAIERKNQAILYGPPGTGKTFVAEHLSRYLMAGGTGLREIVQFHPAYGYEDFVLGIRPQTGPQGTLSYRQEEGRFVSFCERARNREGRSVIIVDEINRANLSEVFGELMYLLEYRDRTIRLAGGKNFSVPENVVILGTMNTADRSIALMDYALRRRFAFLRLDPEYDVLRNFLTPQEFPADELIAILRTINTEIADPNYSLGVSFFLQDDLASNLEDIWAMEIEPYLEEFFFDQPERVRKFAWAKVAYRLKV